MAGESLPALHTQNVGLTFHVDAVNGNDTTGDGSSAAPWASLQKAHDFVAGSATWPTDQDIKIVVHSGTYQANNRQNTLETAFNTAGKRPTATQWVIWEWDGEGTRPKVLLPSGTTPTNHRQAMKLITSGTSFISDFQQFIGFEIDGQQTRTDNPNDTIGIQLDNADNVQFIDCIIHGIYAADTTGTLTSKAFGLFGGSTALNTILYRCQIFDIGTATGTSNGNECAIQHGGSGFALISSLIYDCPNGHGVLLYAGGAAIDNYVIANCTIGGTIEKSCMTIPAHATNAVVKNCILVGSANYGVEYLPNTAGTNNVLSHVIYHDNTAGTKEAAISGWTYSNETSADPLFVDYNGRDFHLSSGSPAIGFCDDAYASVLDVEGNTRDADPDAGAFELVVLDPNATVEPASIGAVGGVPSATVDAGVADNGGELPTVHEPNVGLTIYVDANNGSDSNSGLSLGQAFQTLQRAHNYLQQEATWPTNQDVRVYVRQGTYQAASTAAVTLDTAFNDAARRPNANRWVIWERYPGDERPKIVPPDGSNSTKLAIRTTSSGSTWVGHFQQFRGLEIDGLQQRRSNGDVVGIYISGGNSTTGPVEVVDCEIHGLYANSGKAQGIFMDAATVVVEHKITGCHIYDIGTTTQTINIQEHGIYTSAYGTKIYGNVIHDMPNGFGVQIYRSGNPVNDVLIASNTITGTLEKSCIIVPPAGANIIIKNNILRGAGEYGIEFYPPGGTGTSCVATHNLFFGHGTANRSATPNGWTFSNEVTGDPLFFDFAAWDFRLQAGSPAIGLADPDYATPVDFLGVPRDADPDAGAFERNTSNVVVTPDPIGAVGGLPALTVAPSVSPQLGSIGVVTGVPAVSPSAAATVAPASIPAPAGLSVISFNGDATVPNVGVGVAAGVPSVQVRAGRTAVAGAVEAVAGVPAPTVFTTSFDPADVRGRWTVLSHASRSTLKSPTGSLGASAERGWVLLLLPLKTSTLAVIESVGATAGLGAAVSAGSSVSLVSVGAVSGVPPHIARAGAGAQVLSMGAFVTVPTVGVSGGAALVAVESIAARVVIPAPIAVQQVTLAVVASINAAAQMARPERVRARRGVMFAPTPRTTGDQTSDKRLGSVLMNLATQRARGTGSG